MNYLQAVRQFSRDMRQTYLSWALFQFTGVGINAVVLNLFLLRLSYSAEFIGMAGAARMISFAVFSVLASVLNRRIGMRNTMIVGISIYIVAIAMLPIAEALALAVRSGWVLSTMAISGLGSALFIVSTYPFLATASSAELRSHAFSVQWALQPLSVFAGSIVGGLLPALFGRLFGVPLSQALPYRWALVVSPLLLLVAIPVLFRIPRGHNTQESGEATVEAPADAQRRSAKAPMFIIVIAALFYMLIWSGRGTTELFANVYMDAELHISTARIGLIKAIAQLIAVPGALLAPLLIRRLGRYPTIVLFTLLAGLCLIPLVLISHWFSASVSLVGMLVFFAVSSSASTAFTQEVVDPRWRSRMSAASNMAVGIGMSLTVLTGGFLASRIGYSALFLLCAGLIVGGAGLFLAYFRKPRGEFAKEA